MSQNGLNLYFDHAKGDFKIFKSKLLNIFVVNDVTTDEKKKAYLLTSLCEDTFKLLASLCVPKAPDDLKYTELLPILEKHFQPVHSYFASRRKFYTLKQAPYESVREFAARLRSSAGECGFENTELELLMRDIFVFGLHDSKMQGRLLEEDATDKLNTFDKMFKLALSRESSEQQQSVKSEPADCQHFSKFKPRINSNKYNRPQGKAPDKSKYQQKCQHCGRNNHSSFECNYKNYTCNICNIKGHLAPVCKNKGKQKPKFKTKFIQRTVLNELSLDEPEPKPGGEEVNLEDTFFKMDVIDSGNQAQP